MRARTLSTVLVGALVLAACGSPAEESDAPAASSSGTAATTAEAPPESAAAADATAVAPEPTGPSSTAAPEPTDSGQTSEPADVPVATEPPVATAAPSTEPPAPALPDDGCSADNSPAPTDVAEGPVPSLEVRAESIDNPLPDLAVRRVNCDGGWVNLKNELPAAQPILVWFYAPH